MAQLSVQQITEDGLDVTLAAADSAGDTFVNDSGNRTFIKVDNDDSSAKTVTIIAIAGEKNDQAFGKLTKADGGGSIPAGESRLFGPIYFAAYGANPEISYDAVTGVNVAAVRI